jgi:hypothetical protein
MADESTDTVHTRRIIGFTEKNYCEPQNKEKWFIRYISEAMQIKTSPGGD